MRSSKNTAAGQYSDAMSETYDKRLKQIKAIYPRAYEKWSRTEEAQLCKLFHEGNSVKAVSHILQRQPSAIATRLRKLELLGSNTPDRIHQNGTARNKDVPANGSRRAEKAPLITSISEPSMTLSFSFEWHPVLFRANTPYLFPERIPSFMRARYNGPAVYRWLITPPDGVQDPVIYIGTTKKLCPDRLEGYINPQTSTTNQRINTILHEYLSAGHTINLEILQNCKTNPGCNGTSIVYSVQTQTHRIGLEELLIAYYKHEGITLLNA